MVARIFHSYKKELHQLLGLIKNLQQVSKTFNTAFMNNQSSYSTASNLTGTKSCMTIITRKDGQRKQAAIVVCKYTEWKDHSK